MRPSRRIRKARAAGLRPPYIITYPNRIDVQTARIIRDQFRAVTRHPVVVLDSGAVVVKP